MYFFVVVAIVYIVNPNSRYDDVNEDEDILYAMYGRATNLVNPYS